MSQAKLHMYHLSCPNEAVYVANSLYECHDYFWTPLVPARISTTAGEKVLDEIRKAWAETVKDRLPGAPRLPHPKEPMMWVKPKKRTILKKKA